MALARPAPGGLPIVQVTCVVDSEPGETISRAWASCVGQAAVDVRTRAWWHWDFNTQEELDYWCGLVGCTGGKINPDKSQWCLTDYKWTGNKWVYRDNKTMEGSMTVQDLEGNTKLLKRFEPSEAAKTLGIMVAANGSMKAEVQHLKAKATAFADEIRRPSPTNRKENWMAYKHTICKIMEYPNGSNQHHRKGMKFNFPHHQQSNTS